jgi:gamma-glutamylcyclotransferase (GGCT)/AIG2-like uncharacterized protein YtfP
MEKLFTYGLLKSERILKELLGYVPKIEDCEIKGYNVYSAEDGFYLIKPRKNGKIFGKLLYITSRDLKILDIFEWCPIIYERKYLEALISMHILE